VAIEILRESSAPGLSTVSGDMFRNL
jgi:hypothetical protein